MKRNKYCNNKCYWKALESKKKVYDFTVAYIKENGYAPLLKEIGTAVGLTNGAVSKYIHRLFDEGLLVTDMESSAVRNIALPKADEFA